MSKRERLWFVMTLSAFERYHSISAFPSKYQRKPKVWMFGGKAVILITADR